MIEGTDGSGKATQTGLLVERIKQAGHKVAMVDFPRYAESSSYFITKYLNGGYGAPEDVGPERASLFYALDRFDASFEMRQWINDGKIVVANRYVGSNMGHQGSKIADSAERQKFFRWVHELEYGIMAIPKPDISLFLHVPTEIAYELISKKERRDYIKDGKRDLVESDINHLRNAENTFREMARLFPDEFYEVECAPEGKLMTPEEISGRIWESVQKYV